VTWNGNVIRLPERDYNWMNNLSHRRGKPDLELLAKGYEKEIQAYYDLINGGLTNVS
jgi:hypothetical protein